MRSEEHSRGRYTEIERRGLRSSLDVRSFSLAREGMADGVGSRDMIGAALVWESKFPKLIEKHCDTK
mgnify:CR=1 FL=1